MLDGYLTSGALPIKIVNLNPSEVRMALQQRYQLPRCQLPRFFVPHCGDPGTRWLALLGAM